MKVFFKLLALMLALAGILWGASLLQEEPLTRKYIVLDDAQKDSTY